MVALGFCLLAGDALSVVVAPTAVYMDQRRPAANITLFNPSDSPEEVTLDAVFGYPTTDEDGTLRLFVDEDGRDPRSAAGWIRAYPRRVVVPPGGRQVVRLLGEPPSGLEDGEYWARLVITSRQRNVPVGGVPDTAAVRVGLSLEVRTIIAATFRKGVVGTGLRVEDFTPDVEGDELVLRPRLIREGSAAYIGALALSLENDRGQVVRNWTEQVAVYREYHRRLRYPVGDLPRGSYTLRATLSTDRDDVPPPYRLATTPIELSGEVRLR